MPLLYALGALLMRVGSALLTTIIGRLMLALGISVVTYKGADVLQQQFVRYIMGELNRMPSDVVQIFYLAGGGVALNWIFGATAFALSLMTASRLSTVFKS